MNTYGSQARHGQFDDDVVRKKEASRPQHRFDTRKCERLVEPVIVDKDIRCNDEIERRPRPFFGYHVKIHRRDYGRNLRAHLNPSKFDSFDHVWRPGGRRVRADSIADTLPIANQTRRPWRTRFGRQSQDIRSAGFGAIPDIHDVIVNAGADVEGCEFDLSRPRREAKPQQRIDRRERLHRLHRIEVITRVLVGKIQPRPNHRHASNAAWRNQPLVLHLLQRLFNRKTRQYRCVQRQPPVTKQRGLHHDLPDDIPLGERLFPKHVLLPLGNDAFDLGLQVALEPCSLLGCVEFVSLVQKQSAGENSAFVLVRRGERGNKISYPPRYRGSLLRE